jgi:hypothetical protein
MLLLKVYNYLRPFPEQQQQQKPGQALLPHTVKNTFATIYRTM